MLTVVVVLGCRPDGSNPTPEMVKRVRCGVETATGVARGSCMLMFSGGRTSGRASEASVMHSVYEEMFPEKTIPSVLENRSLDTIGNAFFCSSLLALMDYDRIIVVTSPYHLNRSRYLFSYMLGHSVTCRTFGPVPVQYTQEERKSLMMARALLKGTQKGDLADIWRRMSDVHPLYAGSGDAGTEH